MKVTRCKIDCVHSLVAVVGSVWGIVEWKSLSSFAWAWLLGKVREEGNRAMKNRLDVLVLPLGFFYYVQNCLNVPTTVHTGNGAVAVVLRWLAQIATISSSPLLPRTQTILCLPLSST